MSDLETVAARLTAERYSWPLWWPTDADNTDDDGKGSEECRGSR